MFRVKICGVTTPADARLAADSGADAIGATGAEPSTKCRMKTDITCNTPGSVTERRSSAKYRPRENGPVMISYDGKYATFA